MTLHDLFDGAEVLAMPAAATPVAGLHYDSRKIAPGQVFFAIVGAKADGHRYARMAAQRGAIAVASESAAPRDAALPWIHVREIRKAMAQAASNFFDHPSRNVHIAGVTGTNGKTTTSFLLHAILEAAGRPAGMFGTIEYRLGGRCMEAPNTTPESLDLQAMLAQLRGLANGSGTTYAVMEVSSHALAMDRVYNTRFRVGVFTNLTRDHLDYHGTMEHYLAAKSKLFTGVGGADGAPPDWAVLNADDPHSDGLAVTRNVLWYGLDSPRAQVREPSPETIITPAGPITNRSRLVGRPNAYNRLAAVGAAVALGIRNHAIEQGLASLAAVPGRFESVETGRGFRVIVDYAHTDDALRNVLNTARALHPRRLITVFGCGGDRDRTKRPLMGEAAAALSDMVIVTSDNPRSEDPRAIIEEILPGVRRAGKPHHVEPDRALAINLAISEAREGDVVVIAGKGHETYQVIGKETLPFDDREVARKALEHLQC